MQGMSGSCHLCIITERLSVFSIYYLFAVIKVLYRNVPVLTPSNEKSFKSKTNSSLNCRKTQLM